MNSLLAKTIGIAIENGLLNSNSMIVDSTHTKARYNKKSERTLILEQAKKVRKQLLTIDENFKNGLPSKPTNSGVLGDTLEYCQ